MMRYFLNPWMLIALAGVLIPVIIELLFRRRRRQVELPTIRYLLKSRAEKKIRRQNRLLLILRCIIPLVLAAALARPMLAPEGAAAPRERHVVIVLDDTVSMGQQVGASVAFALAKTKVSRLIRVLPKGTSLTLITLGHRATMELDRTSDLHAAAERIDAMKISHGAGALAESLPLVRKAMTTGSSDEQQELYVFSDFQKTTWLRKAPGGKDPVRELRELRSLGEVFLVDVGGERPFNYFLTELAPEEPLLVADGDFLELRLPIGELHARGIAEGELGGAARVVRRDDEVELGRHGSSPCWHVLVRREGELNLCRNPGRSPGAGDENRDKVVFRPAGTSQSVTMR